jgi:hypothetical protein
MPAAAVYFLDPDANLLEFISILPDAARAELGIVGWSDWSGHELAPGNPQAVAPAPGGCGGDLKTTAVARPWSGGGGFCWKFHRNALVAFRSDRKDALALQCGCCSLMARIRSRHASQPHVVSRPRAGATIRTASGIHLPHVSR